MAIQRSASRRRLVLFNERDDDSQTQEVVEGDPVSTAPTYSRRALPRWLPTAATLAPDSWWKLILCWFLGVAAIAALLALHFYHQRWETVLGSGSLTVFDLTERGNLASWFVFMSLTWGSLLSLVVYFMRRHRVDDYRGGYRIWITAAIAFAIVSVLLTTSLSHALNALMFHLTQWPSAVGSVMWTPIIIGPLVCGFVLRMAIEVRESRLATISLAAATLMLATGWGLDIGVLSTRVLEPELAGPGLTLLGCFQLVFAAASFSRFVLLDAQGKIVRPVKSKAVAEAEETGNPMSRKVEAPTLRVSRPEEAAAADPAPKAKPKQKPKPKPKPKRQKPVVDTGDPGMEEDDDPGMEEDDDDDASSKASRRKQRKMKRRERRSAA